MLRRFAILMWPLALLACGNEDDANSTTDAATAQDTGTAPIDSGETDLGPAPDAAPIPDAAVDADPPIEDAAPPDPDGAPFVPPADRPVTEAGPYAVGFRTLSVTYSPVPDGGERTLRLVIWYPTDAPNGRPARYVNGLVTRPEVSLDAPPAPVPELPLLVFSHGSNGIAEQSFFFTEYMASHGWVVAAPDHTGNTVRDGSPPPEIFWLRPQDITAVMDYLLEGGLPDGDPLKGHLSSDVVVAGHSFGGFTTLAVSGMGYDLENARATCLLAADEETCRVFDRAEVVALFTQGFGDPRVKMGLSWTPPGGPFFKPQDIDVPILLVTASRDETLPNPEHGDLVWAGLDDPEDRRLDFAQAGHFSFTDVCTILPGAIEGDGCGADNSPLPALHDATNAYDLAFIKYYLYGDRDALVSGLIEGTQPLTDLATFSVP